MTLLLKFKDWIVKNIKLKKKFDTNRRKTWKYKPKNRINQQRMKEEGEELKA